MNISMILFRNIEVVSKVSVKNNGKLMGNGIIIWFRVLPFASNILPYAYFSMVFLMLVTYIIMLLIE